MLAELAAAFERLGDNPVVRVVVLAGDGKHFSARAEYALSPRYGHPLRLAPEKSVAQLHAEVAAR